MDGSSSGTNESVSLEAEESSCGEEPRSAATFPTITVGFIEDMVEMFRAGEKNVPVGDVERILEQAKALFKDLPTLVEVDLAEGEKLTIVGDIHGQFFDLLNIFDLNNPPGPSNRYLFNGDIVDRGGFSVECILTVLSYKIVFPDKVFVARGNHESRDLNEIYGFGDELKSKYPNANGALMAKFQKVFNAMPLAHLINRKIFVVHGGLSGKKGLTLDGIRKIRRFKAVPAVGVMSDLLWSDPKSECGVSKNPRGSGILFGPDVTESFCRSNGIDLIIRSHQMMPDGHGSEHGGRVLTVFSAPNYCDLMGNAGAYFTLRGGNGPMKPQVHVFNEVPHPDAPAYAMGNIL